ncbi:MAG: glucans biosynthesis glucosyltransferase MdoH [Roseiarcus sp.]
MSVRPAAPALAPVNATASLTRRRASFAALAGATAAGLLWLALVAIPPRSAAALLFIALFAATLPWSVVGFWNAAIGFLLMTGARDPVAAVNPKAARIRGDEAVTSATAILVCVRNETPDQVTRNLTPLLDGLVAADVAHLFRVYLLSDTSDPEIVATEQACFAAFIAKWRDTVAILHRRRALNTGFKAGNIGDFCDRWGADHEFAVTLDADSFMPAETILRLVRIMQANPTLGILQTLVVGLPSVSAFARLFQFGMRLGMRSHTLGSAWWQGDCGPYWGHNAILRLEPFAAHCRLPVLAGGGPLGGHVLSHDQVEAALMRRAGYEVRVLPVEGISWEENPPTLIEYIRRDLRWCQGNMQYWRLLGLPGLKPVSRFQLLFAILMYLGSPAWMAMVAIGAVAFADAAAQARPGAGSALFAIVLLMIFAPKLASSLDVLMRRSARRSYGGAAQFILNVAGETLFSFLLSPVMALTHTLFLFRLFVLRRGGAWNRPMRESHAVPWRLAWASLWPHSLAGVAVIGLAAGAAAGDIGYALLAAGGLALAAPFAVATASPAVGDVLARFGVGRIPEETEPPTVLLSLRLAAIEAGAPEVRRRIRSREPRAGEAG